MNILQPQVSFPIVRQIANHLDGNTYYVQAVIRDADGNVLETVNLDSQGDQRYQKRWRVVADPSGQGRYISIVTSVYTDSGYTTKSSNYGDEETTYLIFDRVMPAMRGGGSGLDSGTVRRIIQEELKNIVEDLPKPQEIEIPEQKEYDEKFNEVLASVGFLADLVEKLPKKEVDLSPIKDGLGMLATKIDEKEVTPQTDLGPLVEALSEMSKQDDMDLQEVIDKLDEVKESLENKFEKEVTEAIEGTDFVTSFVTQSNRKSKKDKKNNFPQIDPTKLAK